MINQWTFFTAYRDSLAGWQGADVRCALFKLDAFNAGAASVSVLDPATNEVSVAGYARVALTAPNRSAGDFVDYTAADEVDFGTLASGQDIVGVLVYKHVTDDSDSEPWLWADVTATPTDSIDPMVVHFVGGILARLSSTS